eukprot:g18962.t1
MSGAPAMSDSSSRKRLPRDSPPRSARSLGLSRSSSGSTANSSPRSSASSLPRSSPHSAHRSLWRLPSTSPKLAARSSPELSANLTPVRRASSAGRAGLSASSSSSSLRQQLGARGRRSFGQGNVPGAGLPLPEQETEDLQSLPPLEDDIMSEPTSSDEKSTIPASDEKATPAAVPLFWTGWSPASSNTPPRRVSMSGDSIRVFCRIRPESEAEKRREGAGCCLTVEGGKTVKIDPDALREGKEVAPFTFDHVFDQDSTQAEVFSKVREVMLEELFKGYNATIFAYGQTGSGKTWSMMGDRRSAENQGLTPRLVQAIFQYIEQRKEESMEAKLHLHFELEVGYIEIYMERIQDLLDPEGRDLQIREAKGRGIWVDQQTRLSANSLERVMEIMDRGDMYRTTAATGMNDQSSRSHAVFDLKLTQLDKKSGAMLTSSLFLVDLAGSERQSKTGATGSTLSQGIAINRSLTYLGMVIKALSERQKFVPYRDSKLTRLLTKALGGNSKTMVILAASPSNFNSDETIETMRFGSRAKTIKTKAVQNKEYSIADYKRMVKGLREENALLRQANEALTQQLQRSKSAPGSATRRFSLSTVDSFDASAPLSPPPLEIQASPLSFHNELSLNGHDVSTVLPVVPDDMADDGSDMYNSDGFDKFKVAVQKLKAVMRIGLRSDAVKKFAELREEEEEAEVGSGKGPEKVMAEEEPVNSSKLSTPSMERWKSSASPSPLQVNFFKCSKAASCATDRSPMLDNPQQFAAAAKASGEGNSAALALSAQAEQGAEHWSAQENTSLEALVQSVSEDLQAAAGAAKARTQHADEKLVQAGQQRPEAADHKQQALVQQQQADQARADVSKNQRKVEEALAQAELKRRQASEENRLIKERNTELLVQISVLKAALENEAFLRSKLQELKPENAWLSKEPGQGKKPHMTRPPSGLKLVSPTPILVEAMMGLEQRTEPAERSEISLEQDAASRADYCSVQECVFM